MTELPSDKESLSCSPLPSSLRGLVEKWRDRAARRATFESDNSDEFIYQCADELEALLAGAVPSPSMSTREFVTNWLWESGHGPALFNGGAVEQREALIRFANDLLKSAAPAVPQGWQPQNGLCGLATATGVKCCLPLAHRGGHIGFRFDGSRMEWNSAAPPTPLPGDTPKEA